MKTVTIALLGLLLGCSGPAAPSPPPTPVTAPAVAQEAAVAAEPLPQVVEEAAPVVQAPLLDAVEALETVLPPAPPPEPRDVACRRVAAALIIRWEVTSPAYYTRRLRYPVWPGGASGVTWGIGYDGGHQTASVIADDWLAHDSRDRLAGTAGITGTRAKTVLTLYRDIETAYAYAAQVFEDRSLVEYERRASRVFRKGFDDLRPNACGALVSVVYNRGGSMTGDSRREMQVIRDDCIPDLDYACIAREIRSMKRLWIGTVNENGLSARRESEAILAETP